MCNYKQKKNYQYKHYKNENTILGWLYAFFFKKKKDSLSSMSLRTYNIMLMIKWYMGSVKILCTAARNNVIFLFFLVIELYAYVIRTFWWIPTKLTKTTDDSLVIYILHIYIYIYACCYYGRYVIHRSIISVRAHEHYSEIRVSL